MGFAFDGDADRMLAVDGRGRIVDGDHTLYLWGSVLQEQQALPDQRLVATVMSNLGFERAWQARGGILERTPVGDQHVHAAMVSSGAALGGEQSGHILRASHGLCWGWRSDGASAGHPCAMPRRSASADWLDLSFQAYPAEACQCAGARPAPTQGLGEPRAIARACSREQAMGRGRSCLVRASGTGAVLRVMVEADDATTVEHWTGHLAAVAADHLNAA